jgi:hypothetical protein
MVARLEQQLSGTTRGELSFEERLGLLIQHELLERQPCRLKAARGLDRNAQRRAARK